MSAPHTTVLFWDVDGTLLTTARAGILALEAALDEVAGRRIDLDGLVSSGLTDHEVARAVFSTAQLEADDALVARFLRAYERHLPASLPQRRGSVLPGVRSVLEDLVACPCVRNLLLTGNTPAGARAKLDHYGLGSFFAGGAYCTGPERRSEIARRAAELVPGAHARFVIGDTPHDIECGRAIGARTIAVATGSHTREELLEHEPWLALDTMPDPQGFRRLIGLEKRAA